jgi:hypothetical protein
MIKRNSANERVKRRYLQHLKETKGRDESSLDAGSISKQPNSSALAERCRCFV